MCLCELSVARSYGSCIFPMGEMSNFKPKTGTVHLTVTVCVIDPFLALHLVFLGSTMVRPLFILCLGKTWPSDTVVFVVDIVFNDFTGDQVLTLNLMGMGTCRAQTAQHCASGTVVALLTQTLNAKCQWKSARYVF